MSFDDWKIVLGTPHGGYVKYESAEAVRCSSRLFDVGVLKTPPSSLLASGFNFILAAALNLKLQGDCTHLAFLHADISPQFHWIDVLAEEMNRLDADFISAVSPIKDSRGLVSTGIGFPLMTWSPLRRFTMAELMKLPETFSIADTMYPECVLLHNSGCWLADLRKPVFTQLNDNDELECHFTINDRIAFVDGKYKNEVEPEDWFFSRVLHRLGANTYVTRKVALGHFGECEFRNDRVWGYESADETCRELWEKYERERDVASVDLNVHSCKLGITARG